MLDPNLNMEEILNKKTKRTVTAEIERLVDANNPKEINDLLVTLYRNLTVSNAERLDRTLDELQTLIRALHNVPEESLGEILEGITEDNISTCQGRINIYLEKQMKPGSGHKTEAQNATNFVVVLATVGLTLSPLIIVALLRLLPKYRS